jgi:hypothetical protein
MLVATQGTKKMQRDDHEQQDDTGQTALWSTLNQALALLTPAGAWDDGRQYYV